MYEHNLMQIYFTGDVSLHAILVNPLYNSFLCTKFNNITIITYKVYNFDIIRDNITKLG